VVAAKLLLKPLEHLGRHAGVVVDGCPAPVDFGPIGATDMWHRPRFGD
jgi:hypothetical protein